MMTSQQITAALVEVLTASTRPPALRPLRILYPLRQIETATLPDGTVAVTLFHRYKNRNPQSVNTAAVHYALNTLLPRDLRVISVTDHGSSIEIIIGGKPHEN